MSRPEMPAKTPTAVKDYDFDWTDWLPSGDTIASATVSVPAGLTLDSTEVTTTQVKAWLAGGTDGANYAVTCTITTANSPARIEQRTMIVPVRTF